MNMSIFFMLSCLLQTCWSIGMMVMVPWVTAITSLLVLASLIVLNVAIRNENKLLRFPITLWTGWVFFLSFVHVTVAVRFFFPLSGLPELLWSIGCAALMGVIATVYQQFTSSAYEYGLPIGIIWGLVGLLLNTNNKIFFGMCLESIFAIALTMVTVSLITCIFDRTEKNRKQDEEAPKVEDPEIRYYASKKYIAIPVQDEKDSPNLNEAGLALYPQLGEESVAHVHPPPYPYPGSN